LKEVDAVAGDRKALADEKAEAERAEAEEKAKIAAA
jgi:hypothetical protein